jgi:predicted transcriptional regulator of viral defense system
MIYYLLMESSKAKAVLDLARQQGVISPKDLKERGLPPEYLWQFYQKGKLERSGRGLYRLQSQELTEHHSLAEAARLVPRGIVCLLSALRFHELSTQSPFEVWLAIDRKAHKPNSSQVPLHIVRFSGEALSAGIEEHRIEGLCVKIYSPAKTIADCFKYRNKIGLDVSVEALRDCLRKRRATIDEIWRFARICRVARVIRPYLEALT